MIFLDEIIQYTMEKYSLAKFFGRSIKTCFERLERSGLATPIRNESKAIVSFKSNLVIFILKNIFQLGSMAMITFHRVKQGRLLHVGQCII